MFSHSFYFPALKGIASSEFTVCNIVMFLSADWEEDDGQYLYNVISRARVLCRVHMIVIEDETNGENQNCALNKLLDVFRDVRIELGKQYVDELLSLTCDTSKVAIPYITISGMQACDCLYPYKPSSNLELD